MDRYEEALERAKKGLPIDEVFPELKESEDDRIINQIISLIKEVQEDEDWHIGKWSDDAIAWLEKHKEQERIVPEREATDFEIEVHEIIAQARSDKRLADKDVLEQFEKEASCALMWKAEKQLRNAEKQKEQKPAEKITDAEIEQAMDEVTKFKVFAADLAKAFGITHRRDIDWHNFCAGLLTYLELNRPAKWSEEDNRHINTIIHAIHGAGNITPIDGELAEKWFKSLRPSWKPSEQ